MVDGPPRLLSIHQPSYFCWLGLLDKIAKSSTYVVMDAVQLSDGLYQHRNLFLSCDGRQRFLTIPFPKKGYLQKWICDLPIHGTAWQTEHFNFLSSNYRGYPYFAEVMDEVSPVFTRKYEQLIDPILDSMTISMKMFGITTEVLRMSNLNFDRDARKGALVVSIIKAAGFDAYLSGEGAQAYMEEAMLAHESIRLVPHRFRHPVYQQHVAPGTFQPGLANLDVLFNLGIKAAREVFWANVVSSD